MVHVHPPMLSLLISFWWISDEVLLLLAAVAQHWYADRDNMKADFFPPLHALLTNSLSVLNESRSDHLILIGWAAAWLVVHGPRSDSGKMESDPANKKWSARRMMAAPKCICPLWPLMSTHTEERWCLLRASALRQKVCTRLCACTC